jgi:hypothetical protein
VDPVLDPLLLRKSGNAGNQTWDLWICSQELGPLDHRGGCFTPTIYTYIKMEYRETVREPVSYLSAGPAGGTLTTHLSLQDALSDS